MNNLTDLLWSGLKTDITKNRFRNIGYLPRWIIFLIDVMIVSVANLVTYFIFEGLRVSQEVNIPLHYGFVVALNAGFFLLYRTYSGIIRHSTFIDAVRLLVSTTTSFVFLVGSNYLYAHLFGHRIFLTTALFISYVISFLLLFLFRILVKRIFEVFVNVTDRRKLINMVIYGADANAMSVANALRSEVPNRFRIRGFIDQFNQNRTSKRLLNLPIVNTSKKIHVILRALKADALIITEKALTKEQTIAIVEECLEYNFKVFTVPTVTDWEDFQQISKKVKNFAIEDLLDRKPIRLHMDTISNQLKGKTVLITGGAGSIGSEIIRQVIEFYPAKVVIVDQAETPLHNLALELTASHSDIQFRTVLGDIRNKVSMDVIFAKHRPEIVYHAAAYKHVPLMEENPAEAFKTNILGTKVLADLALHYGVDRFVMVSTDKAVNPSNVMGASKRIAEKYVQALQQHMKETKKDSVTKFITTRFGNVLGSNGSIVPLFTKQIQEGGPITITHHEIIRYFMTIPEACQLVLEAGTMGQGGEIYIFDMGQPVKIIDLAKKMIRLAGFTPEKDIEIKIIGLRPGEKLFEELLTDTSRTLPTHNEKILIAQDLVEKYEEINKELIGLVESNLTLSSEDIVLFMKKIVPEYKSMNSKFERLDN